MVVPVTRLQELNGQRIVMDFLMLGFPIVPIRSRFVMQSDPRVFSTNLPMKLNSEGVKKAYIFWSLFYLSGFFWFMTTIYSEGFAFAGGISTIAMLGFHFKFGQTEDNTLKVRKMLETGCGINAMPEWFEKDVQVKIAASIQDQLPEDIVKSWKQSMMTNPEAIDMNLLPSLYALAYYEKLITEKEEVTRVFEFMNKMLNSNS